MATAAVSIATMIQNNIATNYVKQPDIPTVKRITTAF